MSASITAAVIGVGSAAYGASQSGKAAGKAAASSEAGMIMEMQARYQAASLIEGKYEETMADIGALEEIFGPIKENLSNYYSNMSPERYELMGRENIEREYERTNDQIAAVFSNNGMYNSGQALSANLALEQSRELAMGQNTQQAMAQYQGEQMNWLNYGTQQENALRGDSLNLLNNQANAITGMGTAAAQGGSAQAAIYGQQSANWGSLGSAGMQMVGYGLSQMGSFGGQTTLGNPGTIGVGGGQAPVQGPMMSNNSFYSK